MSKEAGAGIDGRALAQALLPAVLEAARLQLGYWRGDVVVDQKSDASPVTAADRESEAILLAALAAHLPGVPVVAEEAVSAGHLPQVGWRFVLVDPLDGTREFVAGREDFTINIALIEDGAPRWGLVYTPVKGELHVGFADEGRGRAGVTDHNGEPAASGSAFRLAVPAQAACPTSLDAAERITTRTPPSNGLTAVASRSHGNAETESFLGTLSIRERISAGSSLKFCLVAQGDADVYPRFGPTMAWDTAAGHAVLSAAGGCVTTVEGTALTYNAAAGRLLNPYFIGWGRARQA
ncbi:MAG: inositol monophosphatase family protein [Pseudomonadota bacterium]